MPTRQDLIVATLKLLNAIAAGQAPEAEDVSEIDATIDGKLEDLILREIAYFADTENFDSSQIDPLAIILANASAPAFGQPRNPDSVRGAEATLLAQKPSTYVEGTIQRVDYF